MDSICHSIRLNIPENLYLQQPFTWTRVFPHSENKTARIFQAIVFFMSILALYVLLLLERRNDKGIPCETLSAAPVSSVFQFAVSGVICFHKEVHAALTHMR